MIARMSLFLAIDAGGTKTRCLLADDSGVLARAATGTVKLMRVSEEEATARLRAMLAEAAAAAGASLGQVTRTCFGLAGWSGPAVQAWARRSLAEMVRGELILCGDEEIALDAGFAGGRGILVIAGTGNNAIGRSANGELFGAGGWGPMLGDEGSGYWIGLEAIRAALRAQDRLGADTAVSWGLLRAIEAHWGLSSDAELVAVGNQRPGPDFAALAPLVARRAAEGDELAVDVLQRAGEALAELVAVVFKRLAVAERALNLELEAEAAAEIGVAFTGSVLSQIAPVRAAMVARLEVSVPGARVSEIAVDPLDGALWRAKRG